MRRIILLALSALVLILPTVASALVYGVKSNTPANPGSIPPTHFFSFQENGSSLTDHGALKLDGQDLNVDALAYSPTYGLRAYDLRNDPSHVVTGSRLISIDPDTLAVTALSGFQDNRNMRGAVFINNDFWVLDALNSQLLKVNPLDGTVLITKNLSVTLSDCCDLAVHRSGAVYLVNYDYETVTTYIYSVDLATGQATLKHMQGGSDNVYVGAAFSMSAPALNLFIFDVSLADDIFVQSVADFSRTLLYANIIPAFNAGRGDLASVVSLDITPLYMLLMD